jgi:CubicO group peptidase (beta-lactamase class C family)
VLAGLALERVTGESYRQYVFDEVFTKADMVDSGFYDRRDAAPRVAEGWDLIDGTWVENIYSYPPIGSPDGGAHVTAGDLVKFIQALRGGALLNAEFTEEFFVPQVEHDEATWYGLGLEFDLNDDGSVRSYYKEGINPGASGILRHYLDERLDVVVLSNSEEGAWAVIREIDERLGG